VRLAALAIFIAGCGCSSEGFGARDADAVKSNERSVLDAFARTGLATVQTQMLERGNPNVAQPEIMPSEKIGLPPGKLELVFPTSRDAPLVARDGSGKIFMLVQQYDVKETRTGRVCGCGPSSGGAAPPPPPAWYVDVDAIDAYGGTKTLVVPWIALDYSYPEASERHCHEIP